MRQTWKTKKIRLCQSCFHEMSRRFTAVSMVENCACVYSCGSFCNCRKGEKTVCEYCGVAVKHIRPHIQTIHSSVERKPVEKKMNACPSCSYRGVDISNFRFHMMMKHNDTSHGTVRVYQCKICDYKHYQKKAIKRHLSGVHGRLTLLNFCTSTPCPSQNYCTTRLPAFGIDFSYNYNLPSHFYP